MAKKRCSWSEYFTKDFILTIVDPDLHKYFKGTSTSEQMITTLIKKKYPSKVIERYNNHLNTLFQGNFHDIEDYAKAIETILERWAACANTSNNEIFAKHNTIFKRGLTEQTLTFMDIHNIQEVEFIFKK